MDTSELLIRHIPNKRALLKRSILQTALTCFNQQGIEATTIDHIRVACDTSVGAIYHHFGNKEGLVAQLFLIALEDQAQHFDQYLASAQSVQDGIYALVYSYVDWVDAHPEWARFLFAARFLVAHGEFQDELQQRNKSRHKMLLTWLNLHQQPHEMKQLPTELIPSLLIGAAENYCRAWLSGRVTTRPTAYRTQLAETAWNAIKSA